VKHTIALSVCLVALGVLGMVLPSVLDASGVAPAEPVREPVRRSNLPPNHPPIRAKEKKKLDGLGEIEALLEDPNGGRKGLERAIEGLAELIAENPEHAYALRLRANLERNAGRRVDALASYAAYLELKPEDAMTRLSYARELLRAELATDAVTQLERVVGDHPRYRRAQVMLAEALRVQGHETRATAVMERVASLETRGIDERPPMLFLPREGHR